MAVCIAARQSPEIDMRHVRIRRRTNRLIPRHYRSKTPADSVGTTVIVITYPAKA